MAKSTDGAASAKASSGALSGV